MPEPETPADLFDLKMLPAWATEAPNENRYADFAGEEAFTQEPRERRGPGGGGERRQRGPRPPRREPNRREPGRREPRGPGGGRGERRSFAPRTAEAAPRRPAEEVTAPPRVEIRFAPNPRALENVLAQIKSGHLAYSVFSLARMFLEKPERYHLRLKGESGPLFQLGEKGAAASDRRFLENGAFANEKENFYRVEVVQSEPVKGNFSSVARDRVTGTLLGPTNHHAYQQKLRGLYEQRFSRRMSFPDFQRQIEIVTDPEVVERWKEEARSLTTYTTLQDDPPQTFKSAGEAERHFRQNYLPALLHERNELTLDGVISRRLPDRALGRVIEDAWAQEMRSPSKMMQELIAAFPANGLHLFRHRKSLLFVAPVRPRAFSHESTSVSPSIAAILRLLAENPSINRKQLLEKMLPADGAEIAPEEVEKRKRTLASDLHWLIGEGHVIEFNDGLLELARAKAPAQGAKAQPPKSEGTAPNESPNEAERAPAGEQSAAEPAGATAAAPVESEPSQASKEDAAPAPAAEDSPAADAPASDENETS